MINARRHVGAIALNGCLYAVGGHSGQEHLSSVECFVKDQNYHFYHVNHHYYVNYEGNIRSYSTQLQYEDYYKISKEEQEYILLILFQIWVVSVGVWNVKWARHVEESP